MGSLENGVPPKRAPLLRSSPSNNSRPFFHRPRSRLARFLLFEKVDYLQWVCAVAAFFLVVVMFQAFLPGSVVERSGNWGARRSPAGRGDFGLLGEFGDLDFGEGIRFVPSKLLERFDKERREANSSSLATPGRRAAVLKPKLALVFADLPLDATQLRMASIAVALKEIGYEIHVFALEDCPVRTIWSTIGLPVTSLSITNKWESTVDWLNYNGILVNSLEGKVVLSCLLQEPFKSLPVVWTIHERSLALRLNQYTVNSQTQVINDWRQAFNRATVIVFPNYLLPIMYSAFDVGNYFVIPGSPVEALRAKNYIAFHDGHDPRVEMGYRSEDFLIAIVGSQFSYSGLFLEHALILQALAPVLQEFSSVSHLKVGILLSDNSNSSYKMALEAVALNFGFSRGSVQQISVDEGMSGFLGIADVVIYGSFLEEQAFPAILIQAMCLGKLVIAPDLGMIRKYVDDRVNGYLFPKENIGMFTEILLQVISNGKLSPLAQNIASIGRGHAKNFMVTETIEGYAYILENVLKLPPEVASPKAVAEIPYRSKEEWHWHLFENITDMEHLNKTYRRDGILDKLEEQWNLAHLGSSANTSTMTDEAFSSIDWAEEKMIELVNTRKRLEEEELKDRTDQPHGTWEEVYRNAKRADRAKNELHERDDRELERTGQPLCIYEPYFGEGTWPFLHHKSLYRGIGLSRKGRRPGGDDIDASSRLSLLNNPYYRDALAEHGAFFALANRIDRIHKNAWIGFQSWRVAARKASLSKKAESALLEAILSRKHGDTLYFWVRMDKDPRNPLQQDFWSFCDSINAGNCRYTVSKTLRGMYGIRNDWDPLPPMPADGDSWSVMHSWALPTRSFLEFVMFSRIFVDALDAQIYEEHHENGHCYLSLSKDRHCYSRVLELLVNVWAYHSARRIIYVDPETGAMQEQHRLKSRRGHMWIRWFSFATLKSMDEDLAEEFDLDHPDRRRLWPSTGEVFWQGIYERERNMRHQQKERRKQQSKEKIRRIRKRARQKTLGKFVKPIPEEMGDSNSTTVL